MEFAVQTQKRISGNTNYTHICTICTDYKVTVNAVSESYHHCVEYAIRQWHTVYDINVVIFKGLSYIYDISKMATYK